MIKQVKFAKQPWRTSRGRNGYIKTTGVEIYDQPLTNRLYDEGEEGALLLHPISTRGEASEACRLSIALSALPEVIAALQAIHAADADPERGAIALALTNEAHRNGFAVSIFNAYDVRTSTEELEPPVPDDFDPAAFLREHQERIEEAMNAAGFRVIDQNLPRALEDERGPSEPPDGWVSKDGLVWNAQTGAWDRPGEPE